MATGEDSYWDKPIKVPRFRTTEGLYTSKVKSKAMSKIRGKDTAPELLLRKALWAHNIRFRIHDKKLPGRPDIVIKKYRLAIFVDGEFWHGKNWEVKKSKIKSNRAFWIPKIERNIQNDRRYNEQLRDMGYTIFRFWADEIIRNREACVNQVLLFIETAKEIDIPQYAPQ